MCVLSVKLAGGGRGGGGGGGMGDTVAGGKRVIYIYGISMCRRFICVFSVSRLLVESGRGTFSLRWG